MNKEIDIINYLDNIKLIFERILKDIYLYNENLSDFILYFQKYDKNNEIMENILIKKFKTISELFYKSVTNHLSIINNEYGFGDKLIKSVKENDEVNIIKYSGMKKLYGEKYIQVISNVATIDNISIEKNFNSEKSIIGYNIYIGKLTFLFNEKYNNFMENISDIISEKKNTLENIEISLISNIDFIKKYKNAFLINIK
jgi:hypothetical protein